LCVSYEKIKKKGVKEEFFLLKKSIKERGKRGEEGEKGERKVG
jgi:hypothetical protein